MPYEKDKKLKTKSKKIFFYSMLVIVSLIAYYWWIKNVTSYNDVDGFIPAERLNNSSFDILENRANSNLDEENKISQVLENTTRSVVGISKLSDNGNSIFLANGANEIGLGSGVIISLKGFILTNEHVSGGINSNCYVTIENGNKYKGRVIWSDSNLDLAIVKVNMNFIDCCVLGNSDDVKLGKRVYAIGNPIGFEFQKTVTSGIVSGTNRTILFKEGENEIYMSNLIQTDATINPGNSGGPLINENGEVIGINTVKITSAEGIGFAVPINSIKPIINKLETNGTFQEAEIGIFAYDKDVIPYLNNNIKIKDGIYVAQISLDSPAFRSGLQVGDIITKIDDVELKRMCDLREFIYGKSVGDVVKLTILRNKREMILDIKLSRK